MNVIDDMKSRADANGDGKLSMEDLDQLKQDHPEMSDKLEDLQRQATGDDGKLDFNDAKEHFGGISDKIKGMF